MKNLGRKKGKKGKKGKERTKKEKKEKNSSPPKMVGWDDRVS